MRTILLASIVALSFLVRIDLHASFTNDGELQNTNQGRISFHDLPTDVIYLVMCQAIKDDCFAEDDNEYETQYVNCMHALSVTSKTVNKFYRKLRKRQIANKGYIKLTGQNLRENKKFILSVNIINPNFLLDFSHKAVSDHDLEGLEDFTGGINLFRCTEITDSGLKYLINTTYINLSCCDQITDEGFEYLTNVKTIRLSNCMLTPNLCFPYLTKVTDVNIYKWTKITDTDLQYLGPVEKIYLTSCTQITDDGLLHLSTVSEIYLDGCNQITDEGLHHLVAVKKIGLIGCSLITEEAKKDLRDRGVIVRD